MEQNVVSEKDQNVVNMTAYSDPTSDPTSGPTSNPMGDPTSNPASASGEQTALTYKIVVDSTADFTRAMWKDLSNDVLIVPLHLDPPELEKLTLDKYYKYLRDHKSDEDRVHTSSGTINDAQGVIGRAFSEGYDVIYLTMAQSLSQGSYRVAKMAAENMRLKYPERKIMVLNSGCASTGLGLLVERLVKKRLPYNKAIEFVYNQAPKIIHIFTVDNFSSLINGGRFDEASKSLSVRILSWKPVQKILQVLGIFVKIIIGFYDDENGIKTMMPLRVKWGKKQLVNGFIKEILRYLPETPDTSPDIVIAYAGDDGFSDKLHSALYDRYPDIYQRTREARIGKVMGTHCGETATAVFFWGTRKLTKH